MCECGLRSGSVSSSPRKLDQNTFVTFRSRKGSSASSTQMNFAERLFVETFYLLTSNKSKHGGSWCHSVRSIRRSLAITSQTKTSDFKHVKLKSIEVFESETRDVTSGQDYLNWSFRYFLLTNNLIHWSHWLLWLSALCLQCCGR